MNKSHSSKILASIIWAILLAPFAVSAQSPLDVVFTPNPLFSEENILPGDGAVGAVTVTNNSEEVQTIITEAINLLDPDSLSAQMELVITDDSTNTFFDSGDGTFQDFLTGGILTLTDPLGIGETVEYTFAISFLSGTGNAFKETTFGFDLCVGFFDAESGINCGDTVVSSEGSTDGGGPVEVSVAASGGGGGGGGIVESALLEISDEHVEELDVEVQTALIEWDTNLYSTSQVVYGLASGGTYSLSLLSPNFGYPSSTPETSNKVLHHAVLLEDLIPNEAYNYRVVSRSSPPTISFEHTFEFEEPMPPPLTNVEPVSGGGGSGSQTEEEIPVGFGGSSSLAVEGQSEGGGGGPLEVLEDFSTNPNDSLSTTTPISRSTRGLERESAETSYTNNQLAVSIFGLPSEFFVSESFVVCFVFFLLMLILVYFGWLLWTFKNRRKYTAQFRAHYCRIYFPTTFFVTMVIAYTFGALCVSVGLLIMFISSLIWAFLDARDDE